MLKKNNFHFVLLTKKDDLPYDLLLLTDETKSAIDKYVFDSRVYVVKNGAQIIAAFCLYEIHEITVELKNIAVEEGFQNLGIGSNIINYIKEISKANYSNIIVGTADCGLNQLRFYERNSFYKFDIRKNFFIENYEFPIIENGIHLKDMVVLKYVL